MSREVPLQDELGLERSEFDQLSAVVRTQQTLADVLQWARASTLPRPILEILTQDEYTHDVVLQLGPDRYLVYDTT